MSSGKRNNHKKKNGIGSVLKASRRAIRFRRKQLGTGIRNRLRRMRRPNLGYIVLPLSGSLPERSQPPRGFIERQLPLPPPQISLQTLTWNLKLIREADTTHGVVVLLKNVSAGLATLQSARQALLAFRESGKKVVVYTPTLSTQHLYLATAADRIVVPPTAEFMMLGMQADTYYLRDALREVGVAFDVVQISPYKTAGNALSKADITAEEHSQVSWLLDERFEMLVDTIAKARGLSADDLKEMIDHAPFGAKTAAQHGLVDTIAYDDQLSSLLAEWWPETLNTRKKKRRKKTASAEQPKRATINTMGKAFKHLPRIERRKHNKIVAIVSMNGPITTNEQQSLLPIGNANSGISEERFVPLLRRIESRDDIAALVVHVNSPGGDAQASDHIWRQLARIRKRKPVVIYMGDVAASGGYYIAMAGDYVIAQPGTTTGSIGVLMGRPSISGLLDKLHVNKVTIKRGKNAGLYRDAAPLSNEERDIIWERIVDTYNQFKRIVASNRPIEFDDLDPVCEGRVWTGRQALAHQLIDAYGNIQDAVQKACELANLPLNDAIEIPVRNIRSKSTRYVAPPELPATGIPSLSSVADLSRKLIEQSANGLASGRPQLRMPFDIDFH